MERFFEKVDKTDDCWIWKAAIRGNSGYGCMKYNGKIIDTHRISWIIHNGKIPEGLCVCHKCDNRKCVNPNHLFLGTHSDNMRDCYNKGRMKMPTTSYFRVGRISTNSSISNEVAIKLKTLINERGEKTLKVISKEENVPYQLIRDISCGRVYKNIIRQ